MYIQAIYQMGGVTGVGGLKKYHLKNLNYNTRNVSLLTVRINGGITFFSLKMMRHFYSYY